MINDDRIASPEFEMPNDKPSSAATSRMIDADEFLELVLSSRKIQRDDGRAVGTRALIDLETGDRFVIEEHQLTRALAQLS